MKGAAAIKALKESSFIALFSADIDSWRLCGFRSSACKDFPLKAVIIYSPLCRFKPTWSLFIWGTQKEQILRCYEARALWLCSHGLCLSNCKTDKKYHKNGKKIFTSLLCLYIKTDLNVLLTSFRLNQQTCSGIILSYTVELFYLMKIMNKSGCNLYSDTHILVTWLQKSCKTNRKWKAHIIFRLTIFYPC